MLNKIIDFSLHNRLLVMIVGVILLVAGTFTARHMEVDVFPDLNAPTVVVMTEASGMAAEEVERTVTFPIETAVNGATDVRRVRSSSTTGFSVVWVEFDWGTDIYLARQIVSEKLAALSEALPQNVGTPTLGPQSSILGELLIVGLTSDSTSLQDLRTTADWTIRPRLLSTGGVAQVTVIGGDIKEYQILLDPERMKHYGVSTDEVLAVAENLSLNSSGGVLNQYGNEYIVRGLLSTADETEMGRSVIKTVDGMPVMLEDIAEVRIGAKAPQLGVASERGKPAVLMTVTKQPNTNSLELTENLDRAIDEIRQTLPPDIHISTDIFRQARFIEGSIDNIRSSLIEGAVFVFLVLFVFLMNFRTTVISLVALPLSLLVSVLVLKMLGLTINTMSLGGMAIAIGSLVDDAIIDVENVFKRLRENRLRPQAERLPALRVVYEASKEIRTSVVHATVITIVAFVPLFFLDGMEGRMLRPLGISFIVALFASMIVAVTLTPVLCSYLLTSDKVLKRNEKEPLVTRKLKQGYRKMLEGVLRHKRAVLGGTLALFAGAVVVFFGLGRSFLPPFNEGSLTINTATMPGISLEESDRIGREVESILLEIPEIRTVARKTGRAELDEHALGVNVSELEAPYTLDERSHSEFLADVRSRLGVLRGVNIELGQPISHRIDAMLSGTKANIAIKLFGPDLNRLFSLGNEIKDAIAGIDGVADLNVEQQVERPQLQIRPRREMLARYGIPLPEFSEFVEVALGGRVVSQVYDQGRSFDVTVRTNDRSRQDMESIGNLLLDGADGKVPLSYVADIVSSSGPNAISRENAQRKIVVSANVADRDLRGVVNDIRRTVEERVDIPQGYHVEYGGQFESEQAASRILLLASLVSLLVIFLLLFQEFRSLSVSGIVMLNLPLALIGGIFSLWFTSGEVSIPAIIGFISLFGIATRNGILLVSHYNQLRSEGMPLYESVVTGSMDRLNPILMTALSSALALVPMALGGHLPGNEIQSPMAKVILGGLLSSTLLNGFIIPAVYLIINRKNQHA
ncbi:efflux RND transporter permease subunit [uncultured Alistipes sp.]|uniref:efflux RND transporter permease subunit n=2 Tax=uncultured Alistipes sp. TaxID=538949 RepID=UPI00262170B5|nr:efflux RND transporter permease subunit [uncultured Alistipes sp.]